VRKGFNTSKSKGAAKRPTLAEYAERFPTPRACEGSKGSPNQLGSKGDMTLAAYVARWPTPTVRDSRGAKSGKNCEGGPSLAAAAKWPTPKSRDHRTARRKTQMHSPDLNEKVEGGGKLSPTWVEWLMGWPLGWTALAPLARDKFRQWLESHGISCCLEWE
jgi:hypothetical protein